MHTSVRSMSKIYPLVHMFLSSYGERYKRTHVLRIYSMLSSVLALFCFDRQILFVMHFEMRLWKNYSDTVSTPSALYIHIYMLVYLYEDYICKYGLFRNSHS